jgi:arginyl-tRNA synthetase
MARFKFTEKLKHLSYGMVELPSGRMKSREGTVVDADELIKETQELAKKEILLREPKIKSKELNERSLKISLGAIKYMLLKIDPTKNMVFNPEEAISFEGNTGPYLLYTYARAKSILSKVSNAKDKSNKISDIEKHLISKLSEFPSVVKRSYESLSPNLIANYAFDISQKFNEFYHSEQVIGSENEEFKLNLVFAFSIVLQNSLNLLGIETLEKM